MAQNYTGEDSDVAQQLTVSEVPAYYVIGPDGKLLGSSSELKELLQAEVER